MCRVELKRLLGIYGTLNNGRHLDMRIWEMNWAILKAAFIEGLVYSKSM